MYCKTMSYIIHSLNLFNVYTFTGQDPQGIEDKLDGCIRITSKA